jgi:hypothetical protein
MFSKQRRVERTVSFIFRHSEHPWAFTAHFLFSNPLFATASTARGADWVLLFLRSCLRDRQIQTSSSTTCDPPPSLPVPSLLLFFSAVLIPRTTPSPVSYLDLNGAVHPVFCPRGAPPSGKTDSQLALELYAKVSFSFLLPLPSALMQAAARLYCRLSSPPASDLLRT